MRFLFINPPMDYNAVGKIFTFESYFPPLGIIYLAKVIEDLGHNAEVFDFFAEQFTEEKLKKALSTTDVVCITISSQVSGSVVKIVDFIKKIYPNMPVIIGGPHCTVQGELALKEIKADISVTGEGEVTIVDLVDALNGKKELSKIHGVFYREKEKIKTGLPSIEIEDLDSISFPSRHLLLKYKYGYRTGIPQLTKGDLTSIITSRGCPFHCTFCISNIISKKYRLRSAENVVAEFHEIQNLGYRSVFVIDDNFLANKKRAIQIMDLMIKENVDLELWIVGSRVDDVEKDLFKKMKKAGVFSLEFGIESGNQDVIDFYNKNITLEKIKKVVKLSNKSGFFTVGNFILGAPIETEKHLRNTIKFAKKLPLDFAYFTPLTYLKGSQIWQKAVDEGKIKPEESFVRADSDRGLGNFTKKDLDDWCIYATRAFYFNPRYLLNQFMKSALYRKNFRLFKSGIDMLFSKEENVINYKIRRK